MRKVLGAAVVALIGVTSGGAYAEDYLTLGAGAFGIRKESTLAAEFLAQYRPDVNLWILKPHAGAMVTTDGGVYGFAGVLAEFKVGDVVITPSTAIGGYYEGNGTDLGHPAEFRSGIEVAYQLENRARLGVGVYHMSNLVFGERNPGAESVMLSYSVPMQALMGK